MKKNNIYNLLLLLGGKSSRYGGDVNKVYCLINNKPIFLYSLDKFLEFKQIVKIIIVYNKSDFELLKNYLTPYKQYNIELVQGGEERYLSVFNGLKKLSSDCTKVIVHDGARPNVSKETIAKAIEESNEYNSLSVGIKVTDTIKKVIDGSMKTISRDNLYTMQTPQITDKDLLIDVLSKVKEEDNITDDLMAIEKYSNVCPHITIGSKDNIKLTTQEDLDYLRYLLSK